jgi:hypothetical protein
MNLVFTILLTFKQAGAENLHSGAVHWVTAGAFMIVNNATRVIFNPPYLL